MQSFPNQNATHFHDFHVGEICLKILSKMVHFVFVLNLAKIYPPGISRELTYPPKKALLKIILLFPKWDMLVIWRVTRYSPSFILADSWFPQHSTISIFRRNDPRWWIKYERLLRVAMEDVPVVVAKFVWILSQKRSYRSQMFCNNYPTNPQVACRRNQLSFNNK